MLKHLEIKFAQTLPTHHSFSQKHRRIPAAHRSFAQNAAPVSAASFVLAKTLLAVLGDVSRTAAVSLDQLLVPCDSQSRQNDGPSFLIRRKVPQEHPHVCPLARKNVLRIPTSDAFAFL